ncbi:MAG TPA: hypothetical protein ENG10_03945 [Candidatus Bathyarchaeota archaeon]|nr:hypothetical protein [Candidatus Bathyarchaeota archaeon]HEX69427.1 hypothetical protein [Candidatus Bathyarchaeota archaeon]
MYEKTVSGIMMTLLFIGMFSLAIGVKPAKSTWIGTVYIRADGSIDPSDAPIITYDNVTYRLTDNIASFGDGIVVERDNLIIDGADHTLEGTEAYESKGIDLSGRTNVTVQNTQIKHFYYGISLYSSSNNSIIGNNIANNEYGIALGYSSNSIYHNNFIGNAEQVYLEGSYGNVWDDGYPSGGNYWSDYEGTDLFSGSYQNVTDGDGIGDTSYIIDEDNVDRYPLLGQFNSFNTSVGYSVDVISNSTIEDFRYFKSNSTIVMHISNMTANQTAGFCRLTIPHELMQPPYTVKVNGTTIEYMTIYENYTEGISIIYFAYEHSRLEITVMPEFPLTILLLAFLMLLTTLIIFIKKALTST